MTDQGTRHHHPDHGHAPDQTHHDHGAGPHGLGNHAPDGSAVLSSRAARLRLLVGGLVALVLVACACLVQVPAGSALIVMRFGNPVRVLTQPGLSLRWPAPFETTLTVDLRTRSTSSGLQDVGTRDGLRVIAETYAVWQVSPEPADITRFVRAVRNQPDQAAEQIRTFLGSSLETTASTIDLSSLINADASRLQIGTLEERIGDDIRQKLLETYGLKVVSIGLERLTLPAVTLDATVDRMRAERETIATERTAEGKRKAVEIRSAAERDARILQADAETKAAEVEAKSRVAAADIYGRAYRQAPELYTLLRSLDTLGKVVNGNTRLVLRTDAAPFRALVEGPAGLSAMPALPPVLPSGTVTPALPKAPAAPPVAGAP